MPNTIAHIGIQSLATRGIFRDADYKWIFIGCVIPDVPWMMQRIVRLISDVNPYDLRLYSVVQASFFFCLILSLVLSTFSKQYWRTFVILSINSFFHLILDALQTKWGNGVHLIAPFNWNLTNFGLFWPESIITYLLTAFGFLYFWIKWPESFKIKAELSFRPTLLFLLLLVYIFVPFLFLPGSEKTNNHFVKTLRSVESRKGKYIEIDRAKYITKENKNILITFAGEEITVEGIKQNPSNTVSIQGIFIHNHLIRVTNYHTHNFIFRDSASYIGILLVAFYFFCNIFWQQLFRKRILFKKNT